jgi:glycerol uptake facilitator protein
MSASEATFKRSSAEQTWIQTQPWVGRYVAEALGVFLIVLFGDACVFVGVLFGVAPDVITLGIGWGLAVGLAVWAAGSISGGHFNPGVTLAMALRRDFPWKQVIPYWISQIIGGFVGAAALDALYYRVIANRLVSLGVAKGAPGSELVSMIFIPYTPNPAMVGIGPASVAAHLHHPDGWSQVALWQGFLGEFIATAILMMFILVLLELRSENHPVGWFFPFGLALAVTMLVVVEAPVSMVSLNAARDLGPRIFLWILGWGKMAFPGPRGGMWTTTVGPTLGAVFGAYFYDFVVRPWFPQLLHAETPASLETDAPAAPEKKITT